MTRTTRQDPPSLGNPRLIFAFGGEQSTLEPQREFALVDEITTIGSAADADLRLDDLERCHGEIRHDENDDYTYVPLGAPASSSVHGRQDEATMLRTGTRVQFGTWTVSFYREEFADKSVAVGSGPGREFARMRADAHRAEARDAATREAGG